MAVGDPVSAWSAITSWLTPPFLFLFLNLTIGTIAVVSSFAARRKQHRHHPQPTYGDAPPPLVRAPSLLDRVRSFNFSQYATELADPSPPDSAAHHHAGESTQLVGTPPVVERLRSFNFSFKRYSSDPEPTIRLADPAGGRKSMDGDEMKAVAAENTGEAPAKQVPVKVTKRTTSAMLERRSAEEEDDVGRRRPATVRESSGWRVTEEDGVDARADDFINRFSQQLKLQRLNSLLRYKEMINRGSTTPS